MASFISAGIPHPESCLALHCCKDMAWRGCGSGCQPLGPAESLQEGEAEELQALCENKAVGSSCPTKETCFGETDSEGCAAKVKGSM